MSTKGLVRIAAVSEAVAVLFFAAIHADRDAIALGVACAVGLALLAWRRTAIVGFALLGLLFIDVAFFTLTAGISNATNAEGLGPVALQLSLAAISIIGLAAVIFAIARRSTVDRRLGWVLGTIAVVAALVSAVSAGSAQAASGASGGSTTLRIETKDTAYSTSALVAGAGEIRINMTNADLFWHTFTIDALGVDLRVPLAGRRSVTFTAAPGVYEFHCQIPGHTQAGMTGTLIVR
jgi:plastocyanin